MKLVYRCCAGLDVHRDTVSACVRRRVRGQAEAVIEEQVFGTFTQDLQRLRRWLKKHKAKQVAMESTGVYWIPVWNVLEGGFRLTLVNPATVRALQGQKTDRIDARRIAEYLQYGLLRGSFIPPKPIRELRALTRMRAHSNHPINPSGVWTALDTKWSSERKQASRAARAMAPEDGRAEKQRANGAGVLPGARVR